MVPRERIGLFGGTFDPIHIGHLAAAQHARRHCHLDRVLMMVAGEPWQKQQLRAITDAELRYEATRLAVADQEGLEVSRLEVDREGPTYTADTLKELAGLHPRADFFLIVGTDAAAKIGTWREAETVARLATLVVVDRPGTNAETLGLGSEWRAERVEMAPLSVSSSEVRLRLREGRPVRGLVPDGALEFITTTWG